MQRVHLRYLAVFAALCAALFLPARYLVVPLADPDPLAQALLRAFDTRPYDVLFFGDSVITETGVCDTGKQRIPEVLEERLGRPVYTVAHWAFSPMVYRDYARLLRRTAYRPRLAVLPITIRDFSSQFFRNPDFHFRERRLRIRRAAEGVDWSGFPHWLVGLVRQDIEEWAYAHEPVSIDGVVLGSNTDIERRAKIPAILECKHEPYDHAQELALRFTYHYMEPIPPDHPLFRDLAATVRELRSQGIAVVAYITPVNVVEGSHYAGPRLGERVAANARLVAGFLERLGVPTLDLHDAVGPDDFIDKAYACEHLDQTGRSLVADALADAIEHRGLLGGEAR